MAIKNNPPEEVAWDALNYTYNDAGRRKRTRTVVRTSTSSRSRSCRYSHSRYGWRSLRS